jgi:hypothetical protein
LLLKNISDFEGLLLEGGAAGLLEDFGLRIDRDRKRLIAFGAFDFGVSGMGGIGIAAAGVAKFRGATKGEGVVGV